MDLTIIFTIVTFIILLGMGVAFYFSPYWGKKRVDKPSEPQASTSNDNSSSQAGRGQRARMRANAARQRFQYHVEEEEETPEPAEQPKDKKPQFPGELKIGAKKQAKLEEKARKKAAREEEEQQREERKLQEQQKEEERKILEERIRAQEKLREELERKEIEEREKREYEEYLQMKAAFSVEGEGFDEEGDNDSERNLLEEFVHYIKSNKVVILEDLAAHFKLKTQAVIDRITLLQNDGILTGVIDDRGKFIYISKQELEKVAKFIKQRGRVSIADLVESSNELINLVPSTA